MKAIYTLVGVLLMAASVQAQSFSVSDETPWVFGTVDEIIHGDAVVANDDTIAYDMHCMRENIDVGAGTENYFCWTQCYGPATDVSPTPLTVDAGTSTEIFASYYNAHGFVGYSVVRYHFFDANNESNEVTFDITYSTDPNGVADSFVSGSNGLSQAFPSPATSTSEMKYSTKPGTKRATVEMFDMLGSKVKSFNLTETEGSVVVDVKDLPSGLYFFNMVVDGNNVDTKKFMVSH